ncbi:MAG: peptide chain release factor 1 [Nitrospinae bacterium]|nr:peptide chain release factor 1 [Nitrospinota bacterium]
MFDKLDEVERRFEELDRLLCDPSVIANQAQFQKYSREHYDKEEIVHSYRDYKKVREQMDANQSIINSESDAELLELVKQDMADLRAKQAALETRLKTLLLPKDPKDSKNVILEIRAGTGGEEAALFVSDLFQMYSKYAERKKFRMEILSCSYAAQGGIKEVIASIEGKGAYSLLKFESGTHRVQRVPETETQGRIHTSAVTVAILPEAEEIDVVIDPTEIRIDVFRSSGPGGQSVNTTDSAIRITHLSTGIVVSCQDEKSQHKNKAKALKILRARLLDQKERKANEERSLERKTQIGTGDRSGRIRTYNFPQGRVTDHRIGLTLYKIQQILEGNIEEITEKLALHYQTEALNSEQTQNSVNI